MERIRPKPRLLPPINSKPTLLIPRSSSKLSSIIKKSADSSEKSCTFKISAIKRGVTFNEANETQLSKAKAMLRKNNSTKLNKTVISKKKRLLRMKSRIDQSRITQTTEIKGLMHTLIKKIKTITTEMVSEEEEPKETFKLPVIKIPRNVQIIDSLLIICVILSTFLGVMHNFALNSSLTELFENENKIKVDLFLGFEASNLIIRLRWVLLGLNFSILFLYLLKILRFEEESWLFSSFGYFVVCQITNLPVSMGFLRVDYTGDTNFVLIADLLDFFYLIRPLFLADMLVHFSEPGKHLNLRIKYKIPNFRIFTVKSLIEQYPFRFFAFALVYLITVSTWAVSSFERFKLENGFVSNRELNMTYWTATWAVLKLGYGKSGLSSIAARFTLVLASIGGIMLFAFIIKTLFIAFSLTKDEKYTYLNIKYKENKLKQRDKAISIIKYLCLLSKHRSELSNVFIVLTKLNVEGRQLQELKLAAKEFNQDVFLKTNDLVEKKDYYAFKISAINDQIRIASLALTRMKEDTANLKDKLNCCLENINATGNKLISK